MAREALIKLGLDISSFRGKVVEALKDLKGLTGKPVEIPVTADTDNAQKELKQARGKFVKAGQDAGEGFNSGFSDTVKGGALGGLLGSIAGQVSQGLQQAFSAAVEAGSNFETALQSVSAVTGVTGDGLNDLGERAKNLALQFGGSATTQLEAFQTVLSKFGPDLASAPEALTKVAESVNVLGKAAGLDAKQSVDALSNSMLQFGVDASDPAKLAQESGRFINVLAASAKVGAAEIPQVAEAILQAGVAAKGANLSFEETNAAIQQLAVGGKVGSEAGVALRNVIGLLTKQSGPGEKALAGVGLSIKDLGETLTTQGLSATLEKLQGGIEKLGTDAEKAAFKATLFGTENASAAGILLGGVNNIKAFTAGVTGTAEAQEQAAKNSDTLAARFEKLKAAVEVGFINAFQAVSPLIKSVFDNFEKFAPILAIVTAGILAYGVAIGVQTLATKLATLATFSFSAALAANPIGATIAAVTLLAAGIYGLVDAFNVSTEEALDNAEAEKKVIEQQIKSNKERTVSVTQTQSLAKEFENLAKKQGRTADEEKRLQDIQRELDKQYPDLIDQTKSFAENLEGVQKIGKATTDELDKLGKQSEELASKLKKSTQNVAFAVRNVAIDAFREAADDADVEDAGEEFVNALFGAKNEQQVRAAEGRFLDVQNKLVAQGKIGSEELIALETQRVEAVNKTIATFNKQAEAVADVNKELEKAPPPQPTEDPDAEKKAEKARKDAEALAKALAALAAQQRELDKQREVAAANLLSDEVERLKELARIERDYANKALEAERGNLKSKGQLRETELETIRLREVANNEKFQAKIIEIDAKAAADRLKLETENAKKLSDASNKLAKDRLAGLLATLKAGNIAIASEVLAAQRVVIDGVLSDTIDRIVQSTPEYVAAAKVIQRELLAGLINPEEAQKRLDELRQRITQTLLATPADAANIYAAQIRAAYSEAADELVKGTNEVTDAVNKALADSPTPGFVKSLKGLKDAINSVDYKGLVKETKKANAEVAKSQEDLVTSLLDGQSSYQDAVAKFAELEQERAAQSSATVEIAGAVLAAAAQQQLDAANEQINVINTIRAENEKLASDLVTAEQNKNAAIAALRAEDFANEQLYNEARAKLEEDYAAKKSQVDQQLADNAEKSDAAQSQALLNIGAAAGTAFAGLLTGAQSAGQALKTIVGDTVASLINLYAPAIIGGFQTIAPGPVGFVLGTAAVTTLKALLKVALAGFSEGGYTGNVGTSDIAGVVHGREFVINARDTQRNRALLEHINRGGTVDTFAGAPSNELAMMRAELQAIRQRLDRVPDLTARREAVDVSVGLDPVLYERGRHRMMARSLRG